MTVTQCGNPVCRRTYRVGDDFLGKLVRCKHCGETFTISATTTPTLNAPSVKPTRSAPFSRVSSRSLSSTSVPKRLGRFEVRERLGGGSYGIVYRAHDPHLDREIALKVPRPGTLDTPEIVERFLREAKAAAQLRHPNIVPIYDAGQDGDQSYIASAYIEGRSLEEASDGAATDPTWAARIVRSLAEALDYAHSQGIIHRDIKPANVMLDGKQQPHVMDFGLARLESSTDKLTRDGTVMGTPAYMSPEQAAGHNHLVTAASDQYSLGVVFYELLTGQTPFGGLPQVVVVNILTQSPKSPRALRPGLPRDLETICLKAMAKEPKQRYASCRDFAADLERWMRGEPIAARPISAVERLVRWSKRNPVISGLAVATALTVILGTTVSVYFAFHANTQRVRADNQAQQARNALAQLEPERQRAEEKAAEASAALAQSEQEKVRADAKAQEAVAEKERAAIREREALRRKYNFTMNQVQQEWNAKRFEEVQRHLASLQSDVAGSVYRGLEWDLWQRRLAGRQTPIQSFPVIGQLVQALIQPNGEVLAVAKAAEQTSGLSIERWVNGEKEGSSDFNLTAAGIIPSFIQLSPDAYKYRITPNGSQLVGLQEVRGPSPDGGPAVFLGVWSLPDLTLLHRLPLRESVFIPLQLAVSPDGKSVAWGGKGSEAFLQPLAIDSPVKVFGQKASLAGSGVSMPAQGFGPSAVAYSVDSRELVHVGHNGTITIFDTETGKTLHSLEPIQTASATAGARVSPKASNAIAYHGHAVSPWICCCRIDGTVELRNTQAPEGGDLQVKLPRGLVIQAIASPDEPHSFVLATFGGTIYRVRQTRDGKEPASLAMDVIASLGQRCFDTVLIGEDLLAVTTQEEGPVTQLTLWKIPRKSGPSLDRSHIEKLGGVVSTAGLSTLEGTPWRVETLGANPITLRLVESDSGTAIATRKMGRVTGRDVLALLRYDSEQKRLWWAEGSELVSAQIPGLELGPRISVETLGEVQKLQIVNGRAFIAARKPHSPLNPVPTQPGTLAVVDLETGKIVRNWVAHTGDFEFSVSEDGERIVTVGSIDQDSFSFMNQASRSLRIWDSVTGDSLFTESLD